MLNPRLIIHAQTSEGFERAYELFRLRVKQRYSLVDCSSMNLMRYLNIFDVLTHDKHFAEEGFNKLF